MHEGPELVLTPAEWEALRAWSAGRPDRGVRARIVLDAAAGVSVSDSARALGVSRPTVASWRGRYAAQGLAGLEHRPRSGRPPRIDDADVITVTLAGPTPPRTAWSARALADHLGISHTALSAVWRRWGVTGDDPAPVTLPTTPPLPCARPLLLGLWQQANAAVLVLAESPGHGPAPLGAPATASERLSHAATLTAALTLPVTPPQRATPGAPGSAGAGRHTPTPGGTPNTPPARHASGAPLHATSSPGRGAHPAGEPHAPAPPAAGGTPEDTTARLAGAPDSHAASAPGPGHASADPTGTPGKDARAAAGGPHTPAPPGTAGSLAADGTPEDDTARLAGAGGPHTSAPTGTPGSPVGGAQHDGGTAGSAAASTPSPGHASPAASPNPSGAPGKGTALWELLGGLRERYPDLALRVLVWDPSAELVTGSESPPGPDALGGAPNPGEETPYVSYAAPEFVSWQGTAGVIAQLELRHQPRVARRVIDSLVAALRAHAAGGDGVGPLVWRRPTGGSAPEPPRDAPRAFDQLALGSFNEKLVIESIREAGALSRVEIAQRTGLTPQAVSRITRNLLTSAFLVEAATDDDRHHVPHRPGGKPTNKPTNKPTSKGKPRVPLRLRADAACAIGIHLDPEMITQVLVDLCGGVLEQRRLPLLGRHDPDWVIDNVARMARETIRARRPASDALLGVGVAVPGPLDAEAGVIINPPLFGGWRDVPLRAALGERLGVPVTVEKDATAAAIGERWIGAGERAADFVYLYLGAGAGCGAFLNGDVYRGRTGNAGEFGQLCALSVGRVTADGRPAMVPECAPMSSVVEKAVAAGLTIPPEPPAPSADPPPSAYERVCAAAAAGDERAVAAIRDVARVVARGAIGVTDLLDTTLLVVGGPAAPAPVAGLYLSEISAAVNEFPVARHIRRVHVAHSLLNESAAAMGAASGVFHASFAPRLRTHARGGRPGRGATAPGK